MSSLKTAFAVATLVLVSGCGATGTGTSRRAGGVPFFPSFVTLRSDSRPVPVYKHRFDDSNRRWP